MAERGDSTRPRFIDRLAELGYKAYPFETVRAEAIETEQASFLLRCLGVAAFAAMNVMMLSVPVWSGNVTDMIPEQRDFFHWLSALIALPAAAYSGQPFFISAFARASRTPHQYGCPDQHRHRAGAGRCRWLKRFITPNMPISTRR